MTLVDSVFQMGFRTGSNADPFRRGTSLKRNAPTPPSQHHRMAISILSVARESNVKRFLAGPWALGYDVSAYSELEGQEFALNVVAVTGWIWKKRRRLSLESEKLLTGVTGREIGNLLPNNRRQRRTCYALCHILYPVSAAHTSIFRMDSNSTSYGHWNIRSHSARKVVLDS